MRRIRRAAVAGALAAAMGAVAGASPALAGPALAGLAVAGPAGTIASVAPAAAAPGASVTFTVSCASVTASATLSGQSLGLPAQIPMDATTPPGRFSIRVTLPGGIRPGTYHPQVTCSDGTSARATFRVLALAASGTAAGPGSGSSPMNTGLTVGGLVLIAVGAVAGCVAIRRRATPRPRRSSST